MKKFVLCLDYGEGFWEFFLTGGYHIHLVLNQEVRIREIFLSYDVIVPYIKDLDDFYRNFGLGEYIHFKHL